jgi:tetratricopeptide (TPR) repeat protein
VQKFLANFYFESGDAVEAEKTLKTILFYYPDDMESHVLLKSLSLSVQRVETTQEEAVYPEPDVGGCGEAAEASPEIAGAGIIATPPEDAIAAEGLPVTASIAAESGATGTLEPNPDVDDRNPMVTGTIAELYVSQGFIDKAVAIYRELLRDDPNNATLLERLRQLEIPVAGETAEESGAQPAPGAAILEEPLVASGAVPEVEPRQSISDRVLAVLESWLENIKRRG